MQPVLVSETCIFRPNSCSALRSRWSWIGREKGDGLQDPADEERRMGTAACVWDSCLIDLHGRDPLRQERTLRLGEGGETLKWKGVC